MRCKRETNVVWSRVSILLLWLLGSAFPQTNFGGAPAAVQSDPTPVDTAPAPDPRTCVMPKEAMSRYVSDPDGMAADPQVRDYFKCRSGGASIPSVEEYRRMRQDEFSALSLSGDSQYVLVSRRDSNYLWKLSSREFVRGLSGRGLNLQLAADGQRALYRDAASGKVSVFDFATGESALTPVALISKDERVGLVSENRTGAPEKKLLINVYDTITGGESKWKGSLARSEGEMPVAMSPHGDTLVTVQYYHSIKFGQLAESIIDLGGFIWTLNGPAGIPSLRANTTLLGVPLRPIASANITLDIASTGVSSAQSIPDMVDADKRFVIWDVRQQRRLLTVNAPETLCATCVAVNTAGNVVMLANEDRSIDAYELPSGSRRHVVKAPPMKSLIESGENPSFDTLQISPDGSKVLRVSPAGTMAVFDASSGGILAEIPKNPDLSAPDFPAQPWFAPDSRYFAVLTGHPHASLFRVWEATTGKLLVSRRQTIGVFAADRFVILEDDTGEQVPVLYNLVTGSEEKFAGIPPGARINTAK